MTAYLESKLSPHIVFLDVGAWTGYYTLLAAGRVRSVVAFEPQAEARAKLWENVHCAGHTNVTVLESPLFSKTVRGKMGRKNKFYPHADGELEAVTLDSLELAPDVIKIDVEGAEMDILIGAEQTLRKYKPILGIEIHEHKIGSFGYRWKQIPQFLQDLGYTIIPLGRRNKCRFIGAE